MNVVGWDKILTAGWETLLVWCIFWGIKPKVHLLAKNALILKLVIEHPPDVEDNLKMFFREPLRGEKRFLKIHLCIDGLWRSFFQGYAIGIILFILPTRGNFFLHYAVAYATTLNLGVDFGTDGLRMEIK